MISSHESSQTELLDDFASGSGVENHGPAAAERDILGISNATFVWSSRHSAAEHHFVLRVDQKLIFQRDAINVIVGPTGSGKTALLMALLGEIHFIPDGPESFVHLPRDSGVAYAPQETWIQNMSIRVSPDDEGSIGTG